MTDWSSHSPGCTVVGGGGTSSVCTRGGSKKAWPLDWYAVLERYKGKCELRWKGHASPSLFKTVAVLLSSTLFLAERQKEKHLMLLVSSLLML